MAFSNIYEGKKVLVTGHTGFKGSWLALWLIHLGAEVYGYALDPYGDKDNFVRCNLSSRINHYVGDVKDRQKLEDYFTSVQPEIVFHLAAQPLVLRSYKDPVETFETNLMGVVNFFEAVRKTPSVKVAINITSDKCYDNKEWVWGYRENDAMGGKDPYSASKGCAELITSSYLHSYFNQPNSCRIASARAGNVIGGGDWAEDRIVPDFFRAQETGTSLYLRNPCATRPWQHVLEPLSGYLHLASALYTDERFAGGWNFGPSYNGNFSVKELIDEMIAYLKSGNFSFPSEAVEKPHEANLLKLDISKAVSILKWQPVLDFNETIAFTADGYMHEADLSSLIDQRLLQIDQYTQKAFNKNIVWAK
ncbi:CDP-glucose 4,6-dehydratase [Aridibaculum aurantiacum]|uniref:CDP-glucose 4,6-dehydratase n=1 Tax=Aridibaculum aurantiacum TaxID=2810307 RepID=UPI001A9564B0|nr:CDP-glucose 4,6-dehydratase [Aridibaculum aurantiacum]